MSIDDTVKMLEVSPPMVKIQFYSRLALELSVTTRQLYKREDSAALFAAFNEVQQKVMSQIASISADKGRYSESDLIRIITTNPATAVVSKIVETSIVNTAKFLF